MYFFISKLYLPNKLLPVDCLGSCMGLFFCLWATTQSATVKVGHRCHLSQILSGTGQGEPLKENYALPPFMMYLTRDHLEIWLKFS